ncbi:MAG: hypothetical protein ACTHK0_12785 [Ginsengibacter sp.]
MNTSTNYAAQFYSNTDNDLEVLEKNVRDFPASSVARFLLLYHHKKNNHPAFAELAKQTAIYLNNPIWSEYQLWQIGNPTENVTDETINTEELPTTVNEDLPDGQAGIIEIPTSEIPSFHEENKENSFTEIKDEEELPTSVNEDLPEGQAGIIEIPTSEIPSFDEENKEIYSENTTGEEELPPSVKEEIIEIPSSELVPGNVDNKDDHTEDIDQPKEAETEPLTEDEKNIQSEDHNLSEEENVAEEKPVSDIKVPDEVIDSSKVNVNSNEEEYDTVAFEPLHTVDYFASQGIKINEEALANDHLVKQVKSFTAWLKSMKKLHPGQMPEQNEVIEKIIQASSESSNKDANVLTEAMAEVLVKQGKREKAMEMYQKLSLINPSKSAYFAAKIESLKII